MNYYCIKDHRADVKFLCTSMGSKELKDLIFFLQSKMSLDICEHIYLDTEDILQLLTNYYGCVRKNLVDTSKPIEMIDLVQLWNENIARVDSIVCNPGFQNQDAENALIKIVEEKHAERFLFINATLRLPKWAEDMYIEPLTLQVTHNGVLIEGLSLLTVEERKKILAFYPQSKFFDNNCLFFDFKDFPPYQYSFSWNGRHICVMEVKESDHAATEIIKQMNIGYYLCGVDMGLPINNLQDLQKLKGKMRLS